jgi:type VI secretion system secreted protein VgrG
MAVEPVTVTHTVEGFHFRSMVGTEEISQPFRYDVELLHESAKLTAEQMLGSNMTLHVVVADGSIRHFNGFVTDFSLRGIVGENALYALTLRPWLSLLEHRINCRILKGKSIDIVKTIFADHGAIAQVTPGTLVDSYPTYEFVVQYRESDLNFVMRTLEKDGIYFYFTHTDGHHSLVLTDADHLKLENYATVQYRPPDVNSEEFQETISDWRAYHSLKPGKLVTKDYNFENATAKLLSEVARPGNHPAGDLEAYDFPGGYAEQGEGDKIVKRRLDALQVARSRFEGAGNVRGFSAGQAFTLEGHPFEDLNKEYLVYSVNFQIVSHALESSSRVAPHGDLMRASVVAFLAADPFRPAPRTPRPSMTGIQTAKVVGSTGSEIDTDPRGYGRVKIKFPWDRDANEEGANSCWVRVSQAWAGTNFGAVFHPRIGQEVLVDFLEGDPDRPIIVGRVYNNKNMPAYTLPINQTQSGIRSRSSLEGGLQNFNEIRFEDKKGSEELFIQAEKTQTTTVKGSQSISVGGNRSVTTTGKEEITVKQNRKVTVHKQVEENYFTTHLIVVGEKQTLTAKEQEFTAEGGIQIIQSPSNKATLKDDVFQVLGGTKVKLAVGETTMIEIEGSSIKITSAGTVDVKGTGIVNIKGMTVNINT